MKKIAIRSIIDFLSDDLLSVYGRYDDRYVDNLADADHVNEYSLDWVNSNKTNKQEIVVSSKAHCLLVDDDLVYSSELELQNKVLLVVKNPRMKMAQIANRFFLDKQEPGIHSTAVIDPSAKVDPSAHIGAGCIIGKATIGAGTVLMPNVVVYDNVEIGEHCLIQAGAVIGTDGLGCSRDEQGRLTKFPHLGGVIIGDDVEIGANSQIAKGSFSDTVIENGCKMNGLCFIAHNCHLEENVWITGNTMLCGSVHVGKNSTLFSSVIVRDQRTIGANVTVGMGSVVTKSIPSGETWLGNPAHKLDRNNE